MDHRILPLADIRVLDITVLTVLLNKFLVPSEPTNPRVEKAVALILPLGTLYHLMPLASKFHVALELINQQAGNRNA